MSNIRNLLAAALLANTGFVLAASSVDLSVKGSITPSACEMSMANAGAFDLGKVAAKDLAVDDMTNLPEQITQLTVTCEAATLVAIESVDNRAGSAWFDEAESFGLGLINTTEKLGQVYAALRAHMVDGETAYGIHSMDGGLTWSSGGSLKPGGLSSTYKGAPMAPIPFRVLSAYLKIYPNIAPAAGLTLTSEVPIDGSIALTVRYL